jgi:C4-dicarboxylate-specific signal transduction histidine kinase
MTTTKDDSHQAFDQKGGLAFFGRMCASISHEIKNCLAVINEQNGLHEDLLMLQKQGRELPPERIERINKTIGAQVQRMDSIIKRLNRFAHSPDNVEEQIDLGEMCAYVAELCKRFAANRGAVLVCDAHGSVATKGQSFLVTHLLVECLQGVFSVVSSGETIVLQTAQGDQGPVIAIKPGLEHTSETVRSLAAAVGAVVDIESGKGQTRIRFQKV